jgi:hypothetical protein
MTPLHLDDDALSAAVDGEATADEQDHLDGCPLCREKVGGLLAVALAVGTPVAPRPAAAAEAAIRAAVDDAGPVAAPAEGSSWAGTSRRDPRLVGSRLARGVLALAAVAAVVLGAGLVVALAGRGPSASKTSSVAARSDQTLNGPSGAAAPAAGAAPSTTSASAAPVSPNVLGSPRAAFVLGPDLGRQSNPADLARIVDSQLAAGAASTPTASEQSGPTSAVAPPCVDQGVTGAGLAGQHPALVYAATVRWQGQDAEVLVYARPGGGRAGVVMRRQDCVLLTTLSL